MGVNESVMDIGSWELSLKPETPRSIIEAMDLFGHVVIVPGRIPVEQYGDNLLDVARYTGVFRNIKRGADKFSIGGPGLAMWLGDEDNKGHVFETAFNWSAYTFTQAIRAVLPSSLTEGSLFSLSGTIAYKGQYKTPRDMLDYIVTTYNAEWRVNPDLTVDAGLVENLYVTSPTVVIARKGDGRDMRLIAIPGDLQTERDGSDITTRVVLLAEGDGSSIATGSANAADVPYKDFFGNEVELTRLVSESDTTSGSAASRAQLALNRFLNEKQALSLNTSDYYIQGTFQVGDYVWVYDPDNGLYDLNNEVQFRGEILNPVAIRIVARSFGVDESHAVAFRRGDGTWMDLTPYMMWESAGASQLTVGQLPRSLSTSRYQGPGDRPNYDRSVPASPAFNTPFSSAAYVNGQGQPAARIIASWNQPLNTDGTTVLDGDYYEIRWKKNGGTEWSYATVAFGSTNFSFENLFTATQYDFAIRLVDTSGNKSAWSATTTQTSAADNVPPSTPAPPSVAGSTLNIQVTHTLGKSTGGTYNLEPDLHHLEVHVSATDTYTPSAATYVGSIGANYGNITGNVAVVATFPVNDANPRYVKVIAVDNSGNHSGASESATVSAILVDSAHISDLTVSKVTAGTISSDWLVGARIATGFSGARVELNTAGFKAYNGSGDETVDIDSATGNVTIAGEFYSGDAGRSIRIATNYIFAVPTITMKIGVDNNRLGMIYVNDATDEFEMGVRRVSGGDQDGGKLLLSYDYAVLSYQPFGIEETMIGLSFIGNQVINMRGKFNGYVSADPTDAIFAFSDPVSTGFSGASYAYGPTMVSSMGPVVSISGTSANFYWCVTTSTLTGFSVGWSDALAHTVRAWCFRF